MFSRLATLITLLAATTQTLAAVSFVLVGDSTTANGTSTNSGGWGNGFCGSTAAGYVTPSALSPQTPCYNTAKNGASTGSFKADGYWAVSIANLKTERAKGRITYVTIQFGHNDQKVGDAALMGTNLVSMVREIKSLGGIPVLVTPLTRRSFSGTTISDTLKPFADEAKRVASVEGVKSIDLLASSIKYLEAIGPDAAHRLNKTPDDNTHLNGNGSILFGRMVADLIRATFTGTPVINNDALTSAIAAGKAVY